MNASVTLEAQHPTSLYLGVSDQEKLISYNDANREVAVLCNHQKTVSRAQEESLERLHQGIGQLETQLVELQSMLRKRKKGKDVRP
eukprot:UN04615